MLAALTLASVGLLVWASDSCPRTCRCFNNLTSIGCQMKGFHQMPELPEATEKLYISYNEIEELPTRGLEQLEVRASDSNSTKAYY